MKLKVTVYKRLCETDKFKINDEYATTFDFGGEKDEDPESADPGGCGDKRFNRIPSTPEVLEKYGITEEEYQEIADKLEEKLSFGSCGLCI